MQRLLEDEKIITMSDMSPDERIYSAPTGPYRPPTILYRSEKQQLHANEDHATFIFVADHGVHSIHFDRRRLQVFYCGHNLDNIAVTETIKTALLEFATHLKNSSETEAHYADYYTLLTRILANRSQEKRPPAA